MKSQKCNMCGKEFDIFDRQEDFQIRRKTDGTIGYGSSHDGEYCDCHLCIRCFDLLMGTTPFRINPFFEPEYNATTSEGTYEDNIHLQP